MSGANLAQLAKLKARFDGMSKGVRLATGPGLSGSADELVATMQQQAPKDTGRLAASIVATQAGDETPPNALGDTQVVPDGCIAITAGNCEVFWAAMVEYGTAKAHAQPFFAQAVRSAKPKIIAGLKSAVLAAAKRLT